MTTLYWFRNDLRLHYNEAIAKALSQKETTIIFLYIFDSDDPDAPEGAARWWLNNSLIELKERVNDRGGQLFITKGSCFDIVCKIIKSESITNIFCSQGITPHDRRIDKDLLSFAQKNDIGIFTSQQSLLNPIGSIQNQSGQFYKVFTPFYRQVLNKYQPIALAKLNQSTTFVSPKKLKVDIPLLDLLEINEPWEKKMPNYWQPGEISAIKKLKTFLKSIKNYDENRNFPAIVATSELSPYIRFGEISVHIIWQECHRVAKDNEHLGYTRQLVWRDFNYHLLCNLPNLPSQPFNKKFDRFPWGQNKKHLEAWQKGNTGYPIVDAGMRQLWETGWMHNRVRMIVASFLCKHLLIHWRAGASWFWQTLVDADIANNVGGWQWTAGCGADAAPYFRIFNPITQGKKFDPQGQYIKEWIPELVDCPTKHIHSPWEYQNFYEIDYPSPIVDHSEARQRALTAYQSINFEQSESNVG